MKGCDVYVANSPEECLKIIKDLDRADVVIIGAEFAMDRDAMLIVNIKKLNMDIKILAIGDESTDKTRIIDYGTDEFALKPLTLLHLYRFLCVAHGEFIHLYRLSGIV
jgi:DNA-binding response OmpR family regulator